MSRADGDMFALCVCDHPAVRHAGRSEWCAQGGCQCASFRPAAPAAEADLPEFPGGTAKEWHAVAWDVMARLSEVAAERSELKARLVAEAAEAARLRETVARVHVPLHGYCVVCDGDRDVETLGNNPNCSHRASFCRECGHSWPCETRRALDGTDG